MPASSIVATAPLAGVDLAAPDPALPHRGGPAARPLDPLSLDGRGVLAAEPHASRLAAGWRPVADYALPPTLDLGRGDAPGRRARIAEEAVAALDRLQRAAAARSGRDRGFQRKTLYATTTAEFRVPDNLPPTLAGGPFQPGATFRAILRFSSAGAALDGDQVPDQRAVGVRITDDAGHVQDLTFTSGSAGNHARDARQFVSTVHAAADAAGGGLGRVRALAGLLRREGPRETLRIARARRRSTDAGVSLAALAYYSRSPFEMGGRLVQLALFPVGEPAPGLLHDGRDARDGLGRDLALRRARVDLRFRLAAAEAPSLTDLSLAPAGPWITVGEIRLPRQAAGEAEMLRVAAKVHAQTAMHPFNRWDEASLRPRGELNEILRGPVYRASAAASGRADDPPSTPQLGA